MTHFTAYQSAPPANITQTGAALARNTPSSVKTAFQVFALASAVAALPATAFEFRTLDGSGNNIANPNWGQAQTPLLRLLKDAGGNSINAYDDGVSVPRGGDTSNPSANPLPSARAVSNAVNIEVNPVSNSAGATDWLWQWGQFIDHDLDLSKAAYPAEPFNIQVPPGDPSFDPGSTGSQEIPMDRSEHTTGTSGVREQVNAITSYLDASQIYGSDTSRALALRDVGNDGRMRMEAGTNGEFMLIKNTGGLDNANDSGDTNLYLSGDVRANEQIGLTATHTLFSREHNRIASDLKARLDAGDTTLVDKRDTAIADSNNDVGNEDDFIYYAARKLVTAQIQKVTYEEFLPTLLGADALGNYGGYDDAVNAAVSNEFSTAAYRFGHTMLPHHILRVDDVGGILDAIELRHAFFNPDEVDQNGADSLFKGLASQSAQEIDTQLVDEVRDFLFGPPGAGGFDLASLNIQRGRDHGLPSYNETRAALGLAEIIDFLELTGGDAALAARFDLVYGDINDVDLWAGGLAEPHMAGAMLGETFLSIIADQFGRSRDGDRFFYLAELDHLSLLDPDFMNTNRLSDIIARNSSVVGLQANVFLLPGRGQVPVPGTLWLIVAGSLLCLRRSQRA